MTLDEDGVEVFATVDDLYASFRGWMMKCGVPIGEIPEVRRWGQEPGLRKFKGDLKSVGGKKKRVRFGVRLIPTWKPTDD